MKICPIDKKMCSTNRKSVLLNLIISMQFCPINTKINTKKRVNRDKTDFATKLRMFGPLMKVLRYRRPAVARSRNLCCSGLDIIKTIWKKIKTIQTELKPSNVSLVLSQAFSKRQIFYLIFLFRLPNIHNIFRLPPWSHGIWFLTDKTFSMTKAYLIFATGTTGGACVNFFCPV